jgi:hypothetical protein
MKRLPPSPRPPPALHARTVISATIPTSSEKRSNSTSRIRKNKTSEHVGYVAKPETSITDVDGEANNQQAFKTDGLIPDIPDPRLLPILPDPAPNNPRIWESETIDEIFERGETWRFIIDNYKNSVGLPAHAPTSIGVGDNLTALPGDIDNSSGGIITTLTSEPNKALLMGLGLTCRCLARRRKSPLSSP